MIVAGRQGRDPAVYHFVTAGGGAMRTSICGKAMGRAKSWTLGKGSVNGCSECITIARRKHGLEPIA